tara:strand:- start:1982 stop:2188 length:207 start_codon:yes stop_codon:yes gene_type:complete
MSSKIEVGSLVQLVQLYPSDKIRKGIVVERVFDPMAGLNKCFKVLWNDGTIGNNVIDYDLELIEGYLK